MLNIVDKRNEIEKAQEELRNNLWAFHEKSGEILIGGLGWHNTCEVYWSEELGIWWAHYTLENRFENAFGVKEPRWNSGYGHSVSCVIDIPLDGINRRIGGAFATDEEELFLLHRGRIGGGRKDIGKTLFLENYRGNLVTVQEGDSYSTVALVGVLNSERFPFQLADFVHELQRIKNYRTTEGRRYKVPSPADTFKEEFTGKKEYSVGHVKAECDHGLVVNSLAEILNSKGFKVANRRPVDLYTYGKGGDGNINSIFEIKTDSENTDCYTAIGQLLVYSLRMKKKPALFAVFPETLDGRFKQVFAGIGIRLIVYKWDKNKPLFNDFKI